MAEAGILCGTLALNFSELEVERSLPSSTVVVDVPSQDDAATSYPVERELARELGPLGEARELLVARCTGAGAGALRERGCQLATLTLASIPPVVGLEHEGERCAVALALPRAPSLASLFERELSWPTIAALGSEFAEALAQLHAHSTPLVLGTIEPEEVLISRDGVMIVRGALGIVPGGPGAQSEDVAALGRFLVARLEGLEPPRHLAQLLARAAHPSASERPTARGLADELQRLAGAPAYTLLREWLAARASVRPTGRPPAPADAALHLPPAPPLPELDVPASSGLAATDALDAGELPDMVLGEVERALSQPPPAPSPAVAPEEETAALAPPPAKPPSIHPASTLSANERDELLGDLDDFLAETPTLPGSEEAVGGPADLAAEPEEPSADSADALMDSAEELDAAELEEERPSQVPLARVPLSRTSRRPPTPPPPPPPAALKPSAGKGERPGMYMFMPEPETLGKPKKDE